MTELERRQKAKIPGEDTGIAVKQSVCDVCAPGPHCGVDCYIKDGKIIKVEGTKEHPANHGLLCPKGQSNRQYIYRKDRVQTPLKRVGKRGEGAFVPIGWDEALDEIAARMNGYKKEYGPESVAFFSGYNKWYRPFLQRMAYAFGSPNYGTESSCCCTSSVMAWRLNTGADKCNPDLANCKLLLGWAYSGYYNQYLSARPALACRERGVKVIMIDHRRTPMAERLCDLFIQIKPGTDAALAFCFANLLIKNDWIDHEYIEENVHGYGEYAAYVERFTPEYTSELTGVAPELTYKAVEMIHENAPVAINESGAALLHHKNGMQGYRAITALSALMGTFDRPGGQIPAFLTDTAKYADIVLPACSGFERGEFRVFGGAHVTYTQPVIEPLHEVRSDSDIIFDLSKRLGLKDPLITSDYDTCLRYILRENPEIDLEEIKEKPYPVRVNAKMHQVGTWKFKPPSGKFELWSEVIAKHADKGFSPIPIWLEPLEGDAEQYPFVMVSGVRRPNVLHSRLHDVPWLQSLSHCLYALCQGTLCKRLPHWLSV